MAWIKISLAALLAAALGAWPAAPAWAAPAAQTQPAASLTPDHGPAGTVVQVNATGFPPGATVDIGVGRIETEYTVVASGQTDAQGGLNTQVAIPIRAEAGERWVVAVAYQIDPRLSALSNAFTVTEGIAAETTVYVVQPNDSLSRVARRFDTTVAALLAANPSIADPRLIFPGQQLIIPSRAGAAPSVSLAPLRAAPGTNVQAVLRGFPAEAALEVRFGPQGQAAASVDTDHRTDVSGGLTLTLSLPSTAVPNSLWVVTAATQAEPRLTAVSNTLAVIPSAPSPAPTTYVVQPGDYMARIARNFGVSLAALIAANPQIENPSLIYAGQVLNIPGGQPPPPSVSIAPLRGPAGTHVQVNTSGLPPTATVTVGVGQANTEPAVIYPEQTTSASGQLSTTVSIPPAAQPGQLWVVQVRTTGEAPISALSDVFAVVAPAAGSPMFTSVPVYLIVLGQGQLGCGDALRAVPRPVPATDQPLPAAIRELLAAEPGQAPAPGALYNAWAQSSLELESVSVDAQGTATVRLVGEFGLGGVCDAPRLTAQIEQTALQFPEVNAVSVLINGEPLESLLGS